MGQESQRSFPRKKRAKTIDPFKKIQRLVENASKIIFINNILQAISFFSAWSQRSRRLLKVFLKNFCVKLNVIKTSWTAIKSQTERYEWCLQPDNVDKYYSRMDTIERLVAAIVADSVKDDMNNVEKKERIGSQSSQARKQIDSRCKKNFWEQNRLHSWTESSAQQLDNFFLT